MEPQTYTEGWLKGMPRWAPRLVLLAALVVIGLFFGLGVLRQLRSFLVLILIAAFLSVALEPGVAFLASKGWKRGLGTAFMFGVVVIGGGTFVALMIPLIVDQVIQLIEKAPGYIDDLSSLADRFGIDLSAERVRQALTDVDADLQTYAADIAGSVFGVGTKLLTTFFQGLTVALFTFYFTAEAPRLRRGIASLLPENRQREVIRVWDIAVEKTGGYFYSRALLALAAALVTWLVLSIVGLPYPLALGLWVGILSQFVPVVGTYIGGALPVLIALLESPAKAIWVVIYIVAYQQLENYVLSPRLTARTMSLHPAVSFGSAIIGGTLLGPAGAIMALPVAATLQAFISTYLHRYEVIEDLEPDPDPGEPVLVE
ncbi:MAG: AI-2E family transporter [Acidimicrobiia bacterium]|nr:AI-2E family transporter [Acidimicrobiia bacterium]